MRFSPSRSTQPWSRRAPQGLEKLTDQRYQLEPACFPDLSPLNQRPQPSPPAWSLAARNLGDKRALEIRLATTTATLQPGGKTGAHTLLYIGDHWALLAWPDQLFAVTF